MPEKVALGFLIDLTHKLDQRVIKGFIVVLGAGLTVFFFWRGV